MLGTLFRRVKMVLSFRKSRVFSRTLFHTRAPFIPGRQPCSHHPETSSISVLHTHCWLPPPSFYPGRRHTTAVPPTPPPDQVVRVAIGAPCRPGGHAPPRPTLPAHHLMWPLSTAADSGSAAAAAAAPAPFWRDGDTCGGWRRPRGRPFACEAVGPPGGGVNLQVSASPGAPSTGWPDGWVNGADPRGGAPPASSGCSGHPIRPGYPARR